MTQEMEKEESKISKILNWKSRQMVVELWC